MRTWIKLLLFFAAIIASKAYSQLDVVLPITPPDGRERIPNGPERPAGGAGGLDDLYFGECGPASYRCNFLHGDGLNRIKSEARMNQRNSLDSFRKRLTQSMSALDEDLENWRNGDLSGNSELADILAANVKKLQDYRLRRIKLSAGLEKQEKEEREQIRQTIEDLAPPLLHVEHTGDQALVRDLAQDRISHEIDITRDRADFVESQISNFSDFKHQRLKLVNVGRIATDVANQALLESDFDKSQLALDFAKGSLDLAVSITPGVGWARDVYEAISGEDLLSGEELTNFERSMAILGAVTGGVGSKIGTGIKIVSKGIDVITDAAKASGGVGDVVNAAGIARRVSDSARKVGVKTKEQLDDMLAWLGKPFGENKELGAIIIGKYNPPPKSLNAFPKAKVAQKRKTLSGGGGKRKRWINDDGKIIEWDAQHAKVEMYDKRGKHLGEFDPETGVQTKPADPTRRIEP